MLVHLMGNISLMVKIGMNVSPKCLYRRFTVLQQIHPHSLPSKSPNRLSLASAMLRNIDRGAA